MEGSSDVFSAVVTAMEGQITSASTHVITILTAGVAIVGAFYVWRVIKRALGASK